VEPPALWYSTPHFAGHEVLFFISDCGPVAVAAPWHRLAPVSLWVSRTQTSQPSKTARYRVGIADSRLAGLNPRRVQRYWACLSLQWSEPVTSCQRSLSLHHGSARLSTRTTLAGGARTTCQGLVGMAHRWALSVSSPGGPLGPYGVRAEQCTSGVAGIPVMGPRGPLGDAIACARCYLGPPVVLMGWTEH